MKRTSINNKFILSFLGLLLIILVVVGITNQISKDFIVTQAISVALGLAAAIILGGLFSKSIVRRLTSLSNVAKEISRGDLSKEIPILSQDEIRDLEEAFAMMVNDLRDIILEIKEGASRIEETGRNLSGLIDKVLTNSREIDDSALAIAKGSEKQTLIVQKTSLVIDKSLEEMDEAARQSAQTGSKANDALTKAETGGANARETLNYLEDVLNRW